MNKRLRAYLLGFGISLALTLLAFKLVWYADTLASPEIIALALLLLALIQLVVQLVFFLHIGAHTPSWNKSALALALLIVFFVVGGSLWIMSNLEHTMRVPFDGAVHPQTEH